MTYDTAELERTGSEALYARGRRCIPAPAESTKWRSGSFVARCVDDKAFRSLEALAAEDLYLACACAEGTRGAAAAFEAEYAKVIRRAVSRAVPKSEDRDDAEQRTLQHLGWCSTQRRACDREVRSGTLSLATWIPWVVAISGVAIPLRRNREHRAATPCEGRRRSDWHHPEHLYIREELRRAVEPAVADALGRLDDRDRLILRLYLVSGLTLRAIGDSLDLSQPAVSKRLAKTRAALLKDVRSALTESLHVSEDESSSILRVVASQLDVNVSRDLRGR